MNRVIDHDRNTAFERLWTTEAAVSIGLLEPYALNELAEARAGTDPIRDLLNRDFAQEALEELADSRNYLLWWLDQIVANADSIRPAVALMESVSEALAGVAAAFDCIQEAQAAPPAVVQVQEESIDNQKRATL